MKKKISFFLIAIIGVLVTFYSAICHNLPFNIVGVVIGWIGVVGLLINNL